MSVVRSLLKYNGNLPNSLLYPQVPHRLMLLVHNVLMKNSIDNYSSRIVCSLSLYGKFFEKETSNDQGYQVFLVVLRPVGEGSSRNSS